ncbi:hypothetical protein ACIBI4_00015 [Streptomyces sp. NPDC050418]|uniref:hypothetical protein n=1 Tax=Streptomyces sp. NPDC050418 TaxID=3365612 RepID=UPI0037B3B34C
MREGIRHEGDGLDAAAVAARLAQAAAWEQDAAERARTLRDPATGYEDFDAEYLAEICTARHLEWRRVQALMNEMNWKVCEPLRDVQGSAWARERDRRRNDSVADQPGGEAWRRGDAFGLRMEVWLSAETTDRITWAGYLPARYARESPVSPAAVVVQILERIVLGENGVISVPPFRPTADGVEPSSP